MGRCGRQGPCRPISLLSGASPVNVTFISGIDDEYGCRRLSPKASLGAASKTQGGIPRLSMFHVEHQHCRKPQQARSTLMTNRTTDSAQPTLRRRLGRGLGSLISGPVQVDMGTAV